MKKYRERKDLMPSRRVPPILGRGKCFNAARIALETGGIAEGRGLFERSHRVTLAKKPFAGLVNKVYAEEDIRRFCWVSAIACERS